MTKTEAAAYLGVGVRTLEGYVSVGKLAVDYEKTRNGPQAFFTQADLDTFKATYQKVHNRKEATHRPRVRLKKGSPASSSSIVPPPIQAQTLDPASLAIKLMLTVTEASSYAGASKKTIRAAIDTGKLPARKVDQEWKVRSSDVRTWVDSLFEDQDA